MAQETQHVTAYPKPAPGAPKFPALEAEVLKFWDSDDTFRSSIQRRDGAQEVACEGLDRVVGLVDGTVRVACPAIVESQHAEPCRVEPLLRRAPDAGARRRRTAAGPARAD